MYAVLGAIQSDVMWNDQSIMNISKWISVNIGYSGKYKYIMETSLAWKHIKYWKHKTHYYLMLVLKLQRIAYFPRRAKTRT